MLGTKRPAAARRRLTEAELAAWRAFMRASVTLVRGMARDLEEVGAVPLPFFGVLLTLSFAPEHSMRLTELADRIFLTKSGLTRLLDRMEERGLVERRGLEEDRRGQIAALTPAGRRALRRSAPAHRRSIARRFADRLPPRMLAAFADACDRLAAPERRGEEA